jgi:hypothetical protein
MSRSFIFFVLAALIACSPSVSPPTPPPTSAAAAPTVAPASSPAVLSPGLTEAMSRVRGLLVDPTDAAIQAAFSPAFLAHIPPNKVKSVFGQAKSHLGSCNDEQVVKLENDTTAVVRVNCDGGADNVAITINPEPPHLIERLLVKPATP